MPYLYPVNEIFYSIQGEGFWTGSPVIFIRFSGCNLKCDFCDTDHAAHTLMDEAQIIAEVRKSSCQTVVLTGGEPALHPLEPLIQALHRQGRRVHIETNGTLPIPQQADWVTLSPKPGSKTVVERPDELKIVYQEQDVEAIRRRFTGVKNLFLQPCSGANIPQTVSYILAHPWWRLSLQTHKMIGVR